MVLGQAGASRLPTGDRWSVYTDHLENRSCSFSWFVGKYPGQVRSVLKAVGSVKIRWTCLTGTTDRCGFVLGPIVLWPRSPKTKHMTPEACFHACSKEVNSRLAKRPFVSNGRLARVGDFIGGVQNCIKSGWFGDISYCQGFDFDPFSVAMAMVWPSLGLRSQGYKGMVAKTRAAQPRKKIFSAHDGALLTCAVCSPWLWLIERDLNIEVS